MENEQIITKKVRVLDENICKKCRFFKIESSSPQVVYYMDQEVYIGEQQYWCDNIRMCQYLQKLFASETPSKVEESESDP